MTLVNTETGEVIDLGGIAEDIHNQYARGRRGAMEMVEAYFSIGRRLLEARELLASDPAFGQWFQSQQFPFSRQWAYTLRRGAESEPEVRELLTTQVVSGNLNFKKAVAEATVAQTADQIGRAHV